jgi:hypothetical protein
VDDQPIARALEDAGGVRAPRERSAQLADLLEAELRRGAAELRLARSGYGAPLVVALAPAERALRAAAPVDATVRADPDAAVERGWLVVATLVGALVAAAGLAPPADAGALALRAGRLDRQLVLAVPVERGDPADAAELAALAYDEALADADRLRTRALAFPGSVLAAADDLRPPIGPTHPLRVAEAVARLGGDPADERSLDAHEDAVLALLEPPGAVARAHEDPDPVRRVARRILQRLDGMGKWGGYHTERTHLARGFGPGNERALALAVADRLLAAGLLVEKVSVGQRHVFLNPRRSGDVRALIDEGRVPLGLDLPT